MARCAHGRRPCSNCDVAVRIYGVHPMSRRVRSFELAVTVRRPGGRLAQESSLECARRHTYCPPECCDEVRRRCEADTVGDLGDGLPWLLQECDPAFKSAENDVTMRCLPGLLVERANEVVDTQTCGVGQLVQCGRRGELVIQGCGDHVVDSTMSRPSKPSSSGLDRPVAGRVQQAGRDTMDSGFE